MALPSSATVGELLWYCGGEPGSNSRVAGVAGVAGHCRGAAKPKHTNLQARQTRTRPERGLAEQQPRLPRRECRYVTADQGGLNKLFGCRGSHSESCAVLHSIPQPLESVQACPATLGRCPTRHRGPALSARTTADRTHDVARLHAQGELPSALSSLIPVRLSVCAGAQRNRLYPTILPCASHVLFRPVFNLIDLCRLNS